MPYLVKRKAEIKKLIGQILFQKVFIDFCHVSLDRKKLQEKYWPSKFHAQKSANITTTDKI